MKQEPQLVHHSATAISLIGPIMYSPIGLVRYDI